MVNTRRTVDPSGEGASSQPPPPPPLTAVEQLVHNQNEMFRLFLASQNNNAQAAAPPPQPRPTSYGDFWATQPPSFSEAKDPLEADNFLRIVESKFALLNCTEH